MDAGLNITKPTIRKTLRSALCAPNTWVGLIPLNPSDAVPRNEDGDPYLYVYHRVAWWALVLALEDIGIELPWGHISEFMCLRVACALPEHGQWRESGGFECVICHLDEPFVLEGTA